MSRDVAAEAWQSVLDAIARDRKSGIAECPCGCGGMMPWKVDADGMICINVPEPVHRKAVLANSPPFVAD